MVLIVAFRRTMALIVALTALASMAAAKAGCPRAAAIAPCTCEPAMFSPDTFEVTCPEIYSMATLRQVTNALQSAMPRFGKLTIRGGSFNFIDHDAFKGLAFRDLVIEDTTFMSLSDADSALEGLEESLVTLTIRNSNALNGWDWRALKNLTNLESIIVDVDMEDVSHIGGLPSAGRVTFLDLSDNLRIAHLDDDAFAAFGSVQKLFLRNNRISELKRSMFPDPADSLNSLDFTENQIRSLPPDLFDNMPKLSIIQIGSNELLTLPEKPFSTIWSQLYFFYAPDNNFVCDCRMLWMTRQKRPRLLNAVCTAPFRNKGYKVWDIPAKNLVC